jgi:hypothetical protein
LPFNPTVLSQSSNPSALQSPSQATPHQYRDGVAIPPPPSLDHRQRVRSGLPKPRQGVSSDPSQYFVPRGGGGTNGLRGGRGGRGGPIRGGAVNGSPTNSPTHGGRGRGTRQETPRV